MNVIVVSNMLNEYILISPAYETIIGEKNENSVNSNPILSSKSFLICVYPSIHKIVIGMIEKSLAITILLFDINNTKCKSI